jgi:hypothetical protein
MTSWTMGTLEGLVRGVDVDVGLETEFDEGDAVRSFRTDFLQVIDVVERGDLRKGGDFRRHFRGVQAGVGPDERDFRTVDSWQDVGGHPFSSHDSEEQDQNGEHPDGVFVAKGEEDDPHDEKALERGKILLSTGGRLGNR